MLKSSLYIVILSALLFSVASCRKKDNNFTDATFVNRLDKDITLDIYASAEDYAANSNLLERKLIPAGSQLVIDGSTFKGGTTYYMDWYTADYYHNNWFNDDYSTSGNKVRFKPEPGANTYYIDATLKGYSRAAYLKDNGTGSTWIAVDAYLYSSSNGYTSQWKYLNNNDRYRMVKVHKNFTSDYTYKDNSGADKTDKVAFMVQQSEVPYIEFKTNDGTGNGNMTGGKLPTGTPPAYNSNAIDTVMALLPNNDYIFMMVRQ